MSELTNLLDQWTARDQLYALRKIVGRALPLSDEEQMAVRSWRRQEAYDLPVMQQERALAALAAWTPPVVKR